MEKERNYLKEFLQFLAVPFIFISVILATIIASLIIILLSPFIAFDFVREYCEGIEEQANAGETQRNLEDFVDDPIAPGYTDSEDEIEE